MQAVLELSQLGKSYPTPTGTSVIVRNVNLRVTQNEFVCIIGHSGCGKSTILSIVMGLIEPTEGGAILAGKEISGPGIDRGVVFQSACLLPWFDAGTNVRLAVDQTGGHLPAPVRKQVAEQYLRLFGLADDSGRYPAELSAGMRQRVGIARALALEPKVLLLDEPFSLLDALTRLELQDELLRLLERDPKTVLMVTHDVDEALYLADRIVMMTSGPAATIGEILEVPFGRPRNRVEVLDHPEYYRFRDHVIGFLDLGIPSGHAYTKAFRTCKSCVGTDFCRYGLGDSIALAQKIERRFQGVESPHKMKLATAGCPRNCSEAYVKDLGAVAIEGGKWEIYLGGAAGSTVRKGDLLATVDGHEEVLQYMGRFIQYYRENAKYLERSYGFVERVGIERLRKVLVEDVEGIAARLDAEIAAAVAAYKDPWSAEAESPVHQAQFSGPMPAAVEAAG